MFVQQSKKGSALYNGLILFAVVVVAASVALAFTKIVRDPKNPDGFRNTLALKRKR